MRQGSGKHQTRKAGPPVVPLQRARVLLPLPLAGAYDYRVPPSLDIQPGDFVTVPLNQRLMTGVVWDPVEGEDPRPVPEHRLKPIAASLPAPRMTRSLRAVRRLGGGLYAQPARRGAAHGHGQYRRAGAADPAGRLDAGRRRGQCPAAADPGPAEGAGGDAAGRGPCRRCAGRRRRGLHRGAARHGRHRAARAPRCCRSQPRSAGPTRTTPGPRWAPPRPRRRRRWRRRVAARAFSVTLLAGVTGSGKTEVYLEAVAEACAQGRQALVLLPEIALSAQWLERFERGSASPPAVWHSELTSAHPPRHLAGGGRGRGPGGGRRPLGAVPAVPRPRPDRGRRGARDRLQAGGRAWSTTPATWRWCAPGWPAPPRCWSRPRPAWRRWPMSRPGATRRLDLPDRHGGATLPAVEAIDLRATPPERGRFLAPAAGRRRSARPWRAASRRCCSSTAAAMRR